jgi:ATP-dependent RNA helicase RhlB
MKSTAEKLDALFKANDITAATITGDLPQVKRMKILSRFKEGKLPVLVATDVASRGLHIEGVTHVINYDLPQDGEDYVHRIGRTARAGAAGKALSFACEDYVYALEDIEEYIKQKIPVKPVEDSLILTDYKKPAPLRRKDRSGPLHGRPQRKGPSGKHHGEDDRKRKTGRRPEKRG